MIIGIICGLSAALCQCVSYIFSKKYIHKDGNAFQLLITSHMIMGIFASICLAVLLLDNDLPPFKDYWFELLKVNAFYMIAQLSFFVAISKTEASRLAPLLGIKIIFIALFGLIFWNQYLSLWQWGAAAICFSGALMSNWSGKSIPFKCVLYLFGAIICYSLSDINIKLLINCLAPENAIGAVTIIIAASLSYFYLGIFSLLVFFLSPSIKTKHLKPAITFSCLWFAAMLFLFACFGLIGPLFGNLVQSGRGIIAVVLGALIAKFGWSEHEEKLPHSFLARRIAAALLITASIVIFSMTQK